jgi:hypothetical protein
VSNLLYRLTQNLAGKVRRRTLSDSWTPKPVSRPSRLRRRTLSDSRTLEPASISILNLSKEQNSPSVRWVTTPASTTKENLIKGIRRPISRLVKHSSLYPSLNTSYSGE